MMHHLGKAGTMDSLNAKMKEYRKLLEKGTIQSAYQGLMAFFGQLKSHLKDKYPEYSISSSIYYGFMDMTYFSFTPKHIKDKKLKIAIVFVYETFQFAVWLAGANRDVQVRYRNLISDRGWDTYHLTENPRKTDYILDHILVEEPDFDDLDGLTDQIEDGVKTFILEITELLPQLE